MKQRYAAPGLDGEALKYYLGQSHRLVAMGLSRKKRKEFNLYMEA